MKKLYGGVADAESALRVAIEALYDAADDDSATGGPDLVRGIYPTAVVIGAEGATKIAENASLREAVKIAVDALRVGIASNGSAPGTELRTLDTSTLEVAILDTSRPRRAFRRISASALEALLPALEAEAD